MEIWWIQKGSYSQEDLGSTHASNTYRLCYIIEVSKHLNILGQRMFLAGAVGRALALGSEWLE